MDLIQKLESEEIARLGQENSGLSNRVTPCGEPLTWSKATASRVQAYGSVVIAKKSRGLNSAFIVRKISSGEGVGAERSRCIRPLLTRRSEVKRKGDVSAAKLYYLRELVGQGCPHQERLEFHRRRVAAGRSEQPRPTPSPNLAGTVGEKKGGASRLFYCLPIWGWTSYPPTIAVCVPSLCWLCWCRMAFTLRAGARDVFEITQALRRRGRAAIGSTRVEPIAARPTSGESAA